MEKNNIKILMLGAIIIPISFSLVSCSSNDDFNENNEYDGTNIKTITKLTKTGDLSNQQASKVGYDFPIENYINIIDGEREWLMKPLKYIFAHSNKFPTRVNYNFTLSSYKNLSGEIINEPINIFISINGFAK